VNIEQLLLWREPRT